MSGYGQFCPVAKAMELLDERWTMLVVRELLAVLPWGIRRNPTVARRTWITRTRWARKACG